MKDTTTNELKQIEANFTTTLVAGSIRGAMKAVEAKSRDFWQIEPAKLRIIEGLNPRVMNDEYRAHIRELADSMKANGFYQDCPLAGYADEHQNVYIYSGHSRLKAVELAIAEGATIVRVPVTISQEGLSMEDMTVALIRGNTGKPLTYYESAVVCKRLVTYGWELDEIANRTGIKVIGIKSRLSLMAAPTRLKLMVANEVISATLAIEMINKHGAKALEVIESTLALQNQTNEGKTRITKAQTQKSDLFERAKLVKKSAPKLYEAAGIVKADPGYQSLSQETREFLDALLTEIRGNESAIKDSIGENVDQLSIVYPE